MAKRKLTGKASRPQQHVGSSATPASMQAKQIETLRTLRWALIVNGITSLAEQARVLGLPRSTAWSILQGNHKGAGLKADVVVRMLRSQQLPEDARRVVIQYVQQRVDGAYGHSELLRRRFVMRLEKLGCASIIQQPDPAKRRNVGEL